MKYVYIFLITMLLCSCFSSKKNAEPVSAALSVTPNEHASILSKPFDESWGRGEYTGVNDLSELIAWINDTSIKSLSLDRGNFSDLSPLTALTELEELNIESNDNITDISPLVSLANLKKLTLFGLHGLSAENMEPISALVNLRYLKLHVWYLNERYFRMLLPLQQLETLILSNGALLDVTYISQMHSLIELEITPGWENQIGPDILNIELLGNLTNLERLTILGGIPNFDISWITSLQNLEYLEMRSSAIDDIRPLLELPNLVTVNLYKTNVQDGTSLLESKSIKGIYGFYGEGISDEWFLRFRERGIEFIPFNSDR